MSIFVTCSSYEGNEGQAVTDQPLVSGTDEPLGSHVLELQVAEVVEETADARSLVFSVPEGPDGPADRLRYAPGQFLTLRVPSDRTGSVARCYSLSSSPFTDDALTVTVKRTVDGYASNWLCEHAHAGMKMHVLAPSGTFVPTSLDDDFLLIAAGSGITPMMAIAKSALSQGSGQVTLLYANRDEKSVIFAAVLRELADKYPDRFSVLHWLESVQGLPSASALARLAGPFSNRQVFICGPGPFMAAAENALQTLQVPPAQIHIEVFRSLDSDPFAAVVLEEDDSDAPPATAIVALDGTTHEVSWPRNAKLLDVLLDKGLDAPFSCREGHCGACAVLMKSGEVDMDVNDVLEQSDLDEGLILSCQARPRTDSVEVTYDE
ncbi:MAG: ferredoxin--NADP reductase [Mycobacterium sp.]|nr:ferredoxin--NADP reductase [Mycobacterium sp.]